VVTARFFDNVTIGGGPAPVRAYIEELLPDILDGRIEPGRVFDRTVDLDGVPTATGRWTSARR
jgi:threonine dehydrogenase-like Zn-dependent dehydrogenase